MIAQPCRRRSTCPSAGF